MPIYLIRCSRCESEQEVYRAFSAMDDLPQCCGEKMLRKPCPPMIMGDIAPYKSMVTGEWITSRSRHREHLRDHKCIEVGNEKLPMPGPLKSPPGLKETIINTMKQKRYL